MTKKRTDLQPLLDYFDLLRRYEQKGYLEPKPEDHEVYITLSAYATLLPPAGMTAKENLSYGSAVYYNLQHMRTYAAWLAAARRGLADHDPKTAADPMVPLKTIPTKELTGYLSQPFSLHIVADEHPHDLITTLLLSKKRHWHHLWRKTDHVDVINYKSEE